MLFVPARYSVEAANPYLVPAAALSNISLFVRRCLCYISRMAETVTLSVRLDTTTRQILAEAAECLDVAGASALARRILERWAREDQEGRRRRSVDHAVSYLAAHPEGWADEPSDFFPGASEGK